MKRDVFMECNFFNDNDGTKVKIFWLYNIQHDTGDILKFYHKYEIRMNYFALNTPVRYTYGDPSYSVVSLTQYHDFYL